jgi:hypothetical protein
MWLVGGLGVAIVGAVVYFIFAGGHSAAGEESRMRWFVCAETKKPFQKEIDIGMAIPVMSPFSGKATGYPAELCFWTKDGKPKDKPTYVLLNKYLGDQSPTFCPDCGRLVVGHNPPPETGRSPPPTKEEWTQRHGTPQQ